MRKIDTEETLRCDCVEDCKRNVNLVPTKQEIRRIVLASENLLLLLESATDWNGKPVNQSKINKGIKRLETAIVSCPYAFALTFLENQKNIDKVHRTKDAGHL